MDPQLYKVLHLAGVVGLFTALGALIATPADGDRKLGNILHGISLLLILVSGFGLLAKLWANHFSWWVYPKLIIWLALGAMVGISKKQVLPKGACIAAVIILGILASFFGVQGKFIG